MLDSERLRVFYATSLVETVDCSSGLKSAWHWPLGGDTYSLPQRPQTGEEALFGSGQRVSVCWHASSRVRTRTHTNSHRVLHLNANTRSLPSFCLTSARKNTHRHTHLEWVRAEEEQEVVGKDKLSLRCLAVSKWAAQNNRLASLTLNLIRMFHPQAEQQIWLCCFEQW